MKSVILWDLLLIVMLVPGIWIGYQKWKIEEDSPRQMTDSEKISALEKRIERLERNVNKN